MNAETLWPFTSWGNVCAKSHRFEDTVTLLGDISREELRYAAYAVKGDAAALAQHEEAVAILTDAFQEQHTHIAENGTKNVLPYSNGVDNGVNRWELSNGAPFARSSSPSTPRRTHQGIRNRAAPASLTLKLRNTIGR